VVGYVGRLTAEKGVLELADAIPLVLARRSDVRFVIVGDGPLKDEMIQRLQQAGCMSSVDFTGWVPYAQVPEALNGMKVHVLPSYTESLPAANLQAMACGTISVANAVGGVVDTVVDNKTGFLLKDNRPQTIADKIIEVLDHPDLQRIQSDARTFVEGNFTYERTVKRWGDVLKGTCTDSP
jgi:glycosyltransferase involved in cell wall biosynthesis